MRSDPARPREPLSSHSSIQILAREDSLPDVRVNLALGFLFLTVEAEHRTPEFDHTTTFTLSGTPVAVDRVLLAMRAAYAARIEPLLAE